MTERRKAKLYKKLAKLDERIYEQGYSLDNLSEIMQDRKAVVILFFLLFKALFFLSNEKAERKERTAKDTWWYRCRSYSLRPSGDCADEGNSCRFFVFDEAYQL